MTRVRQSAARTANTIEARPGIGSSRLRFSVPASRLALAPARLHAPEMVIKSLLRGRAVIDEPIKPATWSPCCSGIDVFPGALDPPSTLKPGERGVNGPRFQVCSL